MAKDDKGQTGPDPKDVQKTMKDYNSTLKDLMDSSRELDKALQGAMSISDQIAKDSKKSQMDRWKQLQDTQDKIFEIMQDVTAQKKKLDKHSGKFDDYIRS